MRTPATVAWGFVTAVTLAAAVASAQEPQPAGVVDGGFETGFISLSLPRLVYFPMVVNGWGSQGELPEIVDDPALAFAGRRSLRLANNPTSPTLVVQDLPLAAAGFVLELAFRIESGTQRIELVSGWDRRLPVKAQIAVALTISATGFEVATSGGSWRFAPLLAADAWHTLRVVADPRTGAQALYLDGAHLWSLPGSPPAGLLTLVLGGGQEPSSFLYDDIDVASLADLELAGLRRRVAAYVDPTRELIVRRLDAASWALARGSTQLAVPELRAARRLAGSGLRGSGRVADRRLSGRDPGIGTALDRLIALLRASR